MRENSQKHQFSMRQLEVLRHKAKGLTDKEVGEKMRISKFGVSDHLTNMRKIVAVKSTKELIWWASENELIDPP